MEKLKNDPASYAAIRDVSLRKIIDRVMYKTDTPAHRQAAREEIARSATHLARLDHDHETLCGLFTPEFARTLCDAISLRGDLNTTQNAQGRRHYQWKLAAALAHIGSIVVDEFVKDMDREIEAAVSEFEPVNVEALRYDINR